MAIIQVENYIGQVADGKIPTSTFFQLQCQRHLNDLLRAKDKGWRFDVHDAQKHMNFMTNVARHTADRWAGLPFNAQPFQLAMIYMLFGWKAWSEDLNDYTRKHTVLHFDIARKNGKTETVAAMASDMLLTSPFGTEVYCCATVKDQAQKTFKSIKAMIHFMSKHSASIRRNVSVHKLIIEVPQMDSILKPLSSDHNTLDGLNPLMAIIDEYHAHKTNYVFGVMQTAQGSRWDGPLLAVTTTAGFDKNYPCYEFRNNAIEVLKGTKEEDNLLPFIFALDDEDDFSNPELWYKPNPNLGVSISSKWMRDQFQAAVNQGPSSLRQFQVKNLNMWVDAETVWIERKAWLSNTDYPSKADMEKLAGKKCFAAVDISARRDFTSIALAFPVQPGLDRPHLVVHFFIPEKRAMEMQKKGYYHMDWIKAGWVSATKQDVVDYEAVQYSLMLFAKKYQLRKVAYDRWGSQHVFVDAMKHSGLEFIPHGQGFGDMTGPTAQFERDIYDSRIRIEHYNNPVLNWQIGNAVIRTDPAGNIKPDKDAGDRQIDGVVAAIMAYGLMYKEKNNPSPYESRGVRVF